MPNGRRQVAHWRRVGRFEDEAVAALVALLCGERSHGGLDQVQVRALALSLELAVRGHVAQRTSVRAVNRLSKRDDRQDAAIAAAALGWATARPTSRACASSRRQGA